MGSGDNNPLQEQFTKLQEIIASMSGVTYSLLHDNQASDVSDVYEPLTRDRRQGLYLAQKNLLRMAERELEGLNHQMRRYSKAYLSLRNQRNGGDNDRGSVVEMAKAADNVDAANEANDTHDIPDTAPTQATVGVNGNLLKHATLSAS